MRTQSLNQVRLSICRMIRNMLSYRILHHLNRLPWLSKLILQHNYRALFRIMLNFQLIKLFLHFLKLFIEILIFILQTRDFGLQNRNRIGTHLINLQLRFIIPFHLILIQLLLNKLLCNIMHIHFSLFQFFLQPRHFLNQILICFSDLFLSVLAKLLKCEFLNVYFNINRRSDADSLNTSESWWLRHWQWFLDWQA